MLESTWYVSSWDPAINVSRLSQVSNPYFECGFRGSVPELVDACKKLVRGETAIVRCLAKPKAADTHWVAVSLRDAGKKTVVPAPPDAPAADPPPPAPAGGDLPAILERLKAEKAPDRMEAAAAIGRLGPGAKAAVPALVAAFPQEKDPFARRAMIAALGAIGPEAREAVPALIAAVRDGYGGVDDLVGYEASVSLSKLDPDGQATVAAISAMLRDKNADGLSRAVAMVRLLGPKMKPLTPALIEATKSPNVGLRCEALRALAGLKLEPAVMLPILTAAVGDTNKYMRLYAATGLASLGPEARGTVKLLMDAVAKEKEPDVKARLIRALRYIGPDAAEAVPMLQDLVKDSNKEVQAQAEKAIKKIKPNG
jgi:HEAT repeat protein